MNKPSKILLSFISLFSLFFLGWGYVGHSIINYNTILTALPEMNFFSEWASLIASHASDADNRKSIDPDESPKHYIDIDNYPEFSATRTIPQNFDSLVAMHGYPFVMDQGILPWAILKTTDSLQAAFENNDMDKAMLLTADLGHYMADAHMPLHITRNYNGQYTNQYGVDSRYESDMIQRFQNQISYGGDSLHYINNLSGFIFNMIYDNYSYVDSVLAADALAKAYAGNTTSTSYYNKFWEISKNFTIDLFKKASYKLTCVIYTAWINASGGIIPVELTSFTAGLSNNKIILNWITKSELNNNGFAIERSADKIEWKTIDFIKGNGTTSEPHQYNFIDDLIAFSAEKIYYRLKQIDYNGNFEYSKTVEVSVAPSNYSLSQNYPNPFNPDTRIRWQSQSSSWQTLKIFDILGNEVATLVDEEKPAGNYEFIWNAINLPSGVYYCQLKAGEFVETKKMLLLK